MSSSTNIATRSAAAEVVLKAVIVTIASADYNGDDWRKFQRSISNTACAVPSTIGGGGHRHIFLLEDIATFSLRTDGTGYTEVPHSGPINFTGATTNAHLARVKETRMTALETYNTQEGAHAGLRKQIINTVPGKLLAVHEDA